MGFLDVAKDFNVNGQRFSFILFIVKPESGMEILRGTLHAHRTDSIYFRATKFVSIFPTEY
jgi:hypothetical protein